MTDLTTASSVILASLTGTQRVHSSHFNYRFNSSILDEPIFNNRSGFLRWQDSFDYTNYGAAYWQLLCEAHALDVLFDAYRENDLRNSGAILEQPPLGLAVDRTHESVAVDPIDAEIKAAFPGPIPDHKLAQLRALIVERNELEREVQRLNTRAVQAELPITDGSDPRLIPVLTQAAQNADSEGYCEVYDNISRMTGFPNRKALGLTKRPGYVDLNVSLVVSIHVNDIDDWANEINQGQVDEAVHQYTQNNTINYDLINTAED